MPLLMELRRVSRQRFYKDVTPTEFVDGTKSMNLRIERWNKSDKPEAQTLRQRLEGEGYSVFEWSDAPRTVYGPHAHAEDQSHWIVSGALELTVGGERYVLRAGDRDFLPANTTHSAFVPGNEPVRYLVGAKYQQSIHKR